MDQIDAKLIMLLQQKSWQRRFFSLRPPYRPALKNWKKKVLSPDTAQKSIQSSLVIILQPLSTWNYSRHRKKFFTLLLRKFQMLLNAIVSLAPIPC